MRHVIFFHSVGGRIFRSDLVICGVRRWKRSKASAPGSEWSAVVIGRLVFALRLKAEPNPWRPHQAPRYAAERLQPSAN